MARAITEINVHCAATRPEWMAGRPGPEKVAEIKRWHVQSNGWSDIAYHFIIDRDGQFYRGRSPNTAGAFEPAVNARAIGICLIGGFGSTQTDPFEKNYTPDQDATLRRLIRALQTKYPAITKVTGHNDYSPKACPGFKVDRWLKRVPPRTIAESGTASGSAAAGAAGTALAVVEAVKVFKAPDVPAPPAAEAQVLVEPVRPPVVQPETDHLKWVLLAIVVAGALYALYRRWVDWKAGRQ